MKITLLTLSMLLTLAAAAFAVDTAVAADRSISRNRKTPGADIQASGYGYYALIVGNDDYRYLPALATAVNDAREVAGILRTRFGFKTRLLLDATRKDILSGINELRKTLTENDSLIIYYAGHGVFDKSAEKSYWLPIDARGDDPVDWIISDDVTSNLKRISARHILVISDSCYSGALTRAAPSGTLSAGGSRGKFIQNMIERPSRTLMASGGNEPVSDSGGGGHSVFAAALIEALMEAGPDVFTAEELFHGRIKAIVAGKSEQVPEYHDIRNSGHEGGDFVFRLAGDTKGDTKKTPRPQDSKTPKKPRGREKDKPAGQILTDPVTGGEFILVPGGCFEMGDTFGDGSADETPVHEVCLNDFLMGRHEVTRRQWATIMGADDSAASQSPDDYPVVNVTRGDVESFIKILNDRANGKYRLPTEAEWEYACRSGGKNERFSGADDTPGDYAWYASNSGKKPRPAGLRKPNGLGLYDLSGNVWEWVEDWYSPTAYAKHAGQNPVNADVEDLRVIRGGGFGNSEKFVRCAARSAVSPESLNPDLGFRLVKEKQ